MKWQVCGSCCAFLPQDNSLGLIRFSRLRYVSIDVRSQMYLHQKRSLARTNCSGRWCAWSHLLTCIPNKNGPKTCPHREQAVSKQSSLWRKLNRDSSQSSLDPLKLVCSIWSQKREAFIYSKIDSLREGLNEHELFLIQFSAAYYCLVTLIIAIYFSMKLSFHRNELKQVSVNIVCHYYVLYVKGNWSSVYVMLWAVNHWMTTYGHMGWLAWAVALFSLRNFPRNLA